MVKLYFLFWFCFPLFFAFSSSSQLFCCSYAKETAEKSFFLFCLFMQRCNTEIDWNCKLIWGRLNTLCFRVDVLLSSDRRLLLLLFLSLLLPIGFGSFLFLVLYLSTHRWRQQRIIADVEAQWCENDFYWLKFCNKKEWKINNRDRKIV